jgi:hypothetical protein
MLYVANILTNPRTPLKTGCELKCSRRVRSSFSTSGSNCDHSRCTYEANGCIVNYKMSLAYTKQIGVWLPLGYLLAIALSLFLWLVASDYPCGILWSLHGLSFDLRLLITPVISCGHCIVSLSLTCGFWLPHKSKKERQCNGHKIPQG